MSDPMAEGSPSTPISNGLRQSIALLKTHGVQAALFRMTPDVYYALRKECSGQFLSEIDRHRFEGVPLLIVDGKHVWYPGTRGMARLTEELIGGRKDG